MALLNYTTKIDADKTIAEITKLLVTHGAKSVLTDYEDGVISAVSFKIAVNGREIPFRLPCDWRPVLAILEADPKVPRRMADQQQAVRTAWRIVKDWIAAQMALIETKMVKLEEVFLSYAVMKDGKTLGETMANNNFLLGSGE